MLLLYFLLASFNEPGDIFLVITPGARAVSMGSAFTALSDDATSIYYNPGALGFIDKAEVSSMNLSFPKGAGRVILNGFLKIGSMAGISPDKIEAPWLPSVWPDMRYIYWSAVMPITKMDAIGVAYTYITTGNTIFIDEQGNFMGSFTSYDYAIGISYGRRLWRSLSFGASLKYIYSYLCPKWVYSMLGIDGKGYAQSTALDLGFMYHLPIPGISIGASWQNLGKGVSYTEGDTEPLPKMQRIGISIQPLKMLNHLNIESDSINLSDNIRYTFTFDWVKDLVGGSGASHDMFYCFGGELTYHNVFSLRLGYFVDRAGERVGITGGYGLNLGALQFEVATDSDIYSFPAENWRLQVNLVSSDKFHHIRKPSKLDAKSAILSSLIIPGGGQFYLGENIKGLLFASGAFYLGERDYREGGMFPKIGLGGLYIVSLADAMLRLQQMSRYHRYEY